MHVPWYVPCATAVCLVCRYFVACFNVSISWLGGGHARGMWLGTQRVYAACGVAFVVGVTGAGWRLPKDVVCTQATHWFDTK